MQTTIIVFLFLGLFCHRINGLQCYSCTLTVAEGEENPDLTCVNKVSDTTGKVKVIKCPARMKFCTVVRNDYISTGGVSSFERNCAEDPVILEGDITGGDLESHYRSCQTDLCNKGTGLEAIGGGPQGNGGGIIIAGLADSGTSLTASVITLLSLLSLNILLTGR